MTAHVFGDAPEGDDSLAPEHVAKFVAHLAGPSGDRINGQVFVVHGGMVALMAPPTVEQKFDAFTDLDGYRELKPRSTIPIDGQVGSNALEIGTLGSLPLLIARTGAAMFGLEHGLLSETVPSPARNR